MSTPPTLTVLSLGGGVQSSVMALMAEEGPLHFAPARDAAECEHGLEDRRARSEGENRTRDRHSRMSMSYTAFISLCRQARQLYLWFTMTDDPIRNPHRTSRWQI